MDGLRLSLQTLAVRLTQGGSPGWQREAAVSAPTAASVSRSDVAAASPDLAQLLAMPLDRFMWEGQPLEIRVPWHTETLWVVPDEPDGGVLGHEGVSRGRVWTIRELMAVMALRDRTPAVVQSLAQAKLAIQGDVVEVRPLRSAGRTRDFIGGRRPTTNCAGSEPPSISAAGSRGVHIL